MQPTTDADRPQARRAWNGCGHVLERAIRGGNERDIVMGVTAVGHEVVSDHGSLSNIKWKDGFGHSGQNFIVRGLWFAEILRKKRLKGR
jgi:hypothetical protein